MKYLEFYVLMAFFFIISCRNNGSAEQISSFTFESNDTTSLFAKGHISNQHYERDMAISPDGKELYFTLVTPRNRFSAIMHCKNQNGSWSEPAIASFSGKFRDLEPAFSPDGNRLYFASNRPIDGDSIIEDMDLWYVERSDNGWNVPVHLDSIINTRAEEFYPSLAANGNLYFTATYPESKGREDIFFSEWKDGQYLRPISLDTMINTSLFEFNAFVAPDESYLIFSSFGREDGTGGGDLYISKKDENGRWAQSVPVEKVNSKRLDYSPFVLGDSILFFTSERTNFDNEINNPFDADSFFEVLNNPQNGEGDIYSIRFR